MRMIKNSMPVIIEITKLLKTNFLLYFWLCVRQIIDKINPINAGMMPTTTHNNSNPTILSTNAILSILDP